MAKFFRFPFTSKTKKREWDVTWLFLLTKRNESWSFLVLYKCSFCWAQTKRPFEITMRSRSYQWFSLPQKDCLTRKKIDTEAKNLGYFYTFHTSFNTIKTRFIWFYALFFRRIFRTAVWKFILCFCVEKTKSTLLDTEKSWKKRQIPTIRIVAVKMNSSFKNADSRWKIFSTVMIEKNNQLRSEMFLAFFCLLYNHLYMYPIPTRLCRQGKMRGWDNDALPTMIFVWQE